MDWWLLSGNPNSIDLLGRNPEKLSFMNLCSNKNATQLIDKQQEKILWRWLSVNPSVREEIMMKCMHPSRLERWIEMGGDIAEFNRYWTNTNHFTAEKLQITIHSRTTRPSRWTTSSIWCTTTTTSIYTTSSIVGWNITFSTVFSKIYTICITQSRGWTLKRTKITTTFTSSSTNSCVSRTTTPPPFPITSKIFYSSQST